MLFGHSSLLASTIGAMAILGQATSLPTDPLGGWASLGVQGVMTGLLAYIVVYLYPAAAKEARAERELRDANFSKLVSDLEVKFEARNEFTIRNLITAIDKQTGAISSALQTSLERVQAAQANLCKAK
jgi:hypothetical protein